VLSFINPRLRSQYIDYEKAWVRKVWLTVSLCPERPKALALKIFNV
jgi:hypothetical protein